MMRRLRDMLANPVRPCLVLLFLMLATGWVKEGYTNCLLFTNVKETGGACFYDSDFLSHWVTARLVVTGHAADTYTDAANDALARAEVPSDSTSPPYNLRGNAYPPTMMVALAPLGFLSYTTAYRVFMGVGLIALVLMAWQWGGMLAVAAALAFPGTWLCAFAGQNGLFTGGMLGLGLAVLSRRPMLAGVFLGMCCVKPQFGLLLPVLLLVGREWRTFWAASVTVVAFVTMSFVVGGGIAVWEAFFHGGMAAAQNILDSWHLWSRFSSVHGALRQQGVDRTVALAFQAVGTVLATVAAALVWRRTTQPGLRAAAALFATLLSVPVVYDYDLPIALAGGLAFLSVGFNRWTVLLFPALVLAYFFLAFFVPLGVRVGTLNIMPFVFWLVLLACLKLARDLPGEKQVA